MNIKGKGLIKVHFGMIDSKGPDFLVFWLRTARRAATKRKPGALGLEKNAQVNKLSGTPRAGSKVLR